MKIGATAGNSAPAWAPVYPGASTQGTFSTQSNEGSQNTFTFKTQDSVEKVLSYYQDQLKSSGFNVNQVSTSNTGGMVQADDQSKGRTIVVAVGSSSEGTTGSVTAVEKK